MSARRGLAALLVATLTGCADGSFHCSGDASCRFGAQSGRCEPNGYCSWSATAAGASVP